MYYMHAIHVAQFVTKCVTRRKSNKIIFIIERGDKISVHRSQWEHNISTQKSLLLSLVIFGILF